ncbi:hypothetical protein MRX96_031900 [Rhipicephalus microplus]
MKSMEELQKLLHDSIEEYHAKIKCLNEELESTIGEVINERDRLLRLRQAVSAELNVLKKKFVSSRANDVVSTLSKSVESMDGTGEVTPELYERSKSCASILQEIRDAISSLEKN